MDLSEGALYAVLIPVVGMIGGFVLAALGIYSGIRRREFEHRERLAMIEKGLTPPDHALPDVDRLERLNAIMPLTTQSGVKERTRRAGVVLMGIGIGIAFLIWTTANEPNVALGVGGFLCILGVAVFLSSTVGREGRGGGADAQRGSSR